MVIGTVSSIVNLPISRGISESGNNVLPSLPIRLANAIFVLAVSASLGFPPISQVSIIKQLAEYTSSEFIETYGAVDDSR